MSKVTVVRKTQNDTEVIFKCSISKATMKIIERLEASFNDIPHQEFLELLVGLFVGDYGLEPDDRPMYPTFELSDNRRLHIGDEQDQTVAWKLTPAGLRESHETVHSGGAISYNAVYGTAEDKQVAQMLRYLARRFNSKALTLEGPPTHRPTDPPALEAGMTEATRAR